MNMTYDEFKKLKKYFYKYLQEEVCQRDNGCTTEGMCELFEEWFNVKENYASVDSYIKELVENGFDY